VREMSDHLRPAAVKAGVLRVAEDGTVYDASGNPVKAVWISQSEAFAEPALLTEEREDLRTVQDMMRHSNSRATLDLYTQSSMAQRIAAQEKLLSRILPQNELVNERLRRTVPGFFSGPS